MTVTLYYLKESRANRIVWLLEELGVPYELKIFHRDEKTYLAPPELKDPKINPNGESPVIIDEDGTVVRESGLIVEYLVDKYGKDTDFAYKDDKDRLAIKHGLYAAEGNISTFAVTLLVHSKARKQMPFGMGGVGNKILDKLEEAYAGTKLRDALTVLQDQIEANGGYCVGGRLTGADIMYLHTVNLAKQNVPDFAEKYPGLEKWLQQLQARPALKKTFEIQEKA